MAIDPQEQKFYDLLPTDPLAPGEQAVRLWIPQSLFRGDEASIEAGVTLKEMPVCQMRDDAEHNGYGNYVLTASAPGAPTGYLWFIFGKPKAATEQGTLVKSWTKTKDHAWPSVLRVLYAMAGSVDEDEETGMQFGAAFAQTVEKKKVFERVDFVKGGSIPTSILVEIFQSPVPFTNLKTDTLLTSRVSFTYLTASFSEDCLHPDVTVPKLLDNGVIVPNLGTPNPENEDYSLGQFFPATKPATWPKKLVIYDDQEFNGTVWVRTRWTATRPKMPPAQEIPLL